MLRFGTARNACFQSRTTKITKPNTSSPIFCMEGDLTFITITIWHLAVHEHQMERSSILRRSLKRIDRFEAVEVGIALEPQLLNKGYGDTLVDEVIFCDTNP
jgi:hypothetical protein